MRSDLLNTIKSSWAIKISRSNQVCRCLHFGPTFRVNSKKRPSLKYPLTSSKYQKSARLVRAYKTHSCNRIFTEMVCSLYLQVKWWLLKFMEVWCQSMRVIPLLKGLQRWRRSSRIIQICRKTTDNPLITK
jgi:hypothetical protein